MRLSMARVAADNGTTPSDTGNPDDRGFGVRTAAWRRMALALAAALILGCVGILFGTPNSAGADTTVFQSGQVFASVGFSTVNVYDGSSGNQITSLTDDTGEPYTAGSAFDAEGNFYVTDDINGDISEFSPSGTPVPTFATGLSNPLSLVFDNSGNLYVGQQTTPYIAEFSPSGQRLPDIGPLATEVYGDDWIDLASDQCTFYYTTEGTDILRYNKCTNTQLPNFNQVPFIDGAAYEVRILQNGNVLVADSGAVLELNSEWKRHSDVFLLVVTGMSRSALRCQCGSERHILLDGGFGLGKRMADRHSDWPGHADSQHQRRISLWVVRRRPIDGCDIRSSPNNTEHPHGCTCGR